MQEEEKLPDGQHYARVQQTPNGQTCVVIVDAFMRRVHRMVPQSGDTLLMDATSNVDRSDSKIFNLLCPAPLGGLPLATLVTTREDEETVTFALGMLQNILPSDAFYGKGPAVGPSVGLTDDSDIIRNSLRKIWPQMVLLLCHFHILQAHWTWLFSGTNKIDKHDKPVLLCMFRELVYSEKEDDFQTALTEMVTSEVYRKYPNYIEYFIKYVLPKKDEWALLYRINEQLPTNNVNVTNLVEVSFR